MKFQVYEDTGPIRHPETREKLSDGETIVKANLDVQEIREKVTIMKTTTNQYTMSFSEIASIGSSLGGGGFTTSSQEQMDTADDTPENIMVVERGDPIRQVVEEDNDPIAEETDEKETPESDEQE